MSFYQAMQEVLETSRYDRLMGRGVNIRELISDWADRLFGRIPSNPNANISASFPYNLNVLSVAFVLVGIILAVVAAIAIFHIIRDRNKPETHDLGSIFEELANRNYTVQELMKLSHEATETRVAIRYRYIAALLALHERQLIEIKASATNITILQQVKEGAPALLPHLTYAVDIFHQSWFGYKDIGQDAFRQFSNNIHLLMTGGVKNE